MTDVPKTAITPHAMGPSYMYCIALVSPPAHAMGPPPRAHTTTTNTMHGRLEACMQRDEHDYSHRRALRNARIKKSCLALLRFTYGNCCELTIYILINGAYGPESCFLNARR